MLADGLVKAVTSWRLTVKGRLTPHCSSRPLLHAPAVTMTRSALIRPWLETTPVIFPPLISSSVADVFSAVLTPRLRAWAA